MGSIEIEIPETSVAVIIINSSAPTYVLPGAGEVTTQPIAPAYVLPKVEANSNSEDEGDWENCLSLRVVRIINFNAIETNRGTEIWYILVPGPQAVELRETELNIGPKTYLVVKHTEESLYYFRYTGSNLDETNHPILSLYIDLIH